MNFQAKIIQGRGRGQKLGYPTLNLVIQSGAKPEPGVYCVRLAALNAIMHVGPRPTFNDTSTIEIHVLDTAPPRVTELVQVEVLGRLRDTARFNSPEALKKQIEQDIMAARKYFASNVSKT